MPKARGAPPKDKDPEAIAIGLRLRGIMEEWQYATVDEFAEALGEERNRVSNWLNGTNPPPLAMGKKIKEKFPAITLDWLYCGDARTLQSWLGPRLVARIMGEYVAPARIDPTLPEGAIVPPAPIAAEQADTSPRISENMPDLRRTLAKAQKK